VPSARAIANLRTLTAPPWLLLSSGEALLQLLGTLPRDAVALLRKSRVVAASLRLAELARAQGFTRVAVADNARPGTMLAAAAQAASSPRKRG